MVASSLPKKRFNFGLQPAPAWTAILAFVLFSALCILAGAGSILRLAFPAGAFFIAVFLYRRYPILYLGFTWWLWFLTPWVRRLIDYRSSFVEPSTLLLAPYAATIVTVATLWKHLPKSYSQGSLPFVVSLTGVIYACILGLINSKFGFDESFIVDVLNAPDFTTTPVSVIIRSLEWIIPIIFSFHLFVNWQYYPQYKQNIQKTFLWGILFMGVYALIQYLIAPEWDRFWLTNVAQSGATAFGLPEPLKIRLFSTMNSPGPFAVVLMAGLLVLLTNKETLRFLASGIGYLVFLLTLVRTLWGVWILTVFIFMNSLKPKLQMRLIITILIVGICAFPLANIEPFSKVINSRMQTLSNVQKDGSYQARAATYNRALGVALMEPVGKGVGLPGVDSAVIDILFAMGWLGAIPYVGGLFLLTYQSINAKEKRLDPFINISSAISIGLLTTLIGGNALTAVSGVIIWSFLSLSLAGQKYYKHQLLLAHSVNFSYKKE
jgi:hypothetical protein